MSRRFFVTSISAAELQILSGPEARHVQQVLRMQPGDRLAIFDGTGTEADAEILRFQESDTGTSDVVLRIVARRQATNELPSPLTIATAVPKGDRLKWMIEKLTELGVTRYIPLLTERSVVDPREGKLERLKQTVIEASKQCGRSSLMEIGPVTPWKSFLETEIRRGPLWIAHPYGNTAGAASIADDPQPHIIAIGPEGGLTDLELQSATEAGAKLLSLGRRILRIETAALAAATLFGIAREH
ncbi:MAG: 16S rRNA (uracil(1498)-N(3))-methyltransferase [Planctomycetaceae bacterium]|nr:16S rRNA (uracil(1498)-N(3))-methyltransferase [Planctomycetaceae bacterium]